MLEIIEEHFNEKFLDKMEFNFIENLLKSDQGHLFKNWDKPGINDDKKKALLETLMAIDKSYHNGGVKGYIANAKKLLEDSKKGVNPYKDFIPEQPAKTDLSKPDEKFRAMEELGLKHVDELVIVMVAGGLGERLGYNDIKIKIPFEIIGNTTYIKYYMDSIKALQDRIFMISKKETEIPFIIMTSDDTHEKTEINLEQNSYFGLNKDRVILLKQDLVPALSDNSAHIALTEPYSILLKPHGHGDIHTLIYKNKILDNLMKLGKKYIIFIQDTNAQVFNAILPALGVSVTQKFIFNFIAIPRVPKEAIGAITKLKGGKNELTVNIEYNELDSLIRETVNKNGDVPDENGLSIFPGNPNIFMIDINFYDRLLKRTRGNVPEFINPKYADGTKTSFLKPARIESLMQDITKLFDKSDSPGVTVLDRKWCFSPNKNNIIAAKGKCGNNIPCESAASAESDHYLVNRKKLTFGNIEFEKGKVHYFYGVPFLIEARVILSPEFCLTLNDIKEKIKCGYLARESTLVLNGQNIFIENLILMGNSGLIINAAKNSTVTVRDLTLNNNGFEILELTKAEMENPDFPQYLKIRGYKILIHDPLIINITAEGKFEIGTDGILRKI